MHPVEPGSRFSPVKPSLPVAVPRATAQATAAQHAPADAFVSANKPKSPYDAAGLPLKALARGAHEPAVEHLQRALVKLGLLTPAQLATGPGWFGPRTEAALAHFQAAHHLPATGAYEAGTRLALAAALGHPAPLHAPAHGAHAAPAHMAPQPGPAHPAPQHRPAPHHPAPHHPAPVHGVGALPHGTAAQYAFFKRFVAAQGGTFQTGPNRMNLIGLRKDDRVGRGGGQYSDALYAVFTDSHGRPHVQRFHFTTEPAQQMRWDAGDANGDGSRDLGRIPSGHFRYQLSRRSNGNPCLRPVSSFRPERDVNHDGKFTEHYRSGDGSAFLFHQGGNHSTGSAGCQTFPPSEWKRFWSTVSHAHGALTYTLTTKVPRNA